jgi:hypothetical protein
MLWHYFSLLREYCKKMETEIRETRALKRCHPIIPIWNFMDRNEIIEPKDVTIRQRPETTNIQNIILRRRDCSTSNVYSLALQTTTIDRQTAKIPPAATCKRSGRPCNPLGIRRTKRNPDKARNTKLKIRPKKTQLLHPG